MMQYIVERIEGDWAVIEMTEGENISYCDIKMECLPAAAREGSILEKSGDQWKVCKKETDERRNQMLQRLKKLTR